MFAWVNSPIENVTVKNSSIGNTKLVFEPVETEELVYSDGKVYLENTSAREDFLVTDKRGLSVERI